MSKQSIMADQTIDSHVLWAMGAGAIPLPILDVAAVTAVQLNLCKELCMIYQSDYNEAYAKNIISALAGASLAKIGASFLKAIPVVGAFLGSMPMVVLAGASTYAMGQVFKKHLEIGGFLSAFSFENAQKIYEDAFEKGQNYVNDLRKQATQAMGYESAETPTQEEERPTTSTQETTKTTEPAKDYNDLSPLEKLKKLAELRDLGVLTQEEFQAKKDILMKEI